MTEDVAYELKRSAQAFQALTPREKEVALLVADGHDNKTIALILGIEVNTLKNHITAALDNFGVNSRTQLAVRLIRLRLLATPAQETAAPPQALDSPPAAGGRRTTHRDPHRVR